MNVIVFAHLKKLNGLFVYLIEATVPENWKLLQANLTWIPI